MSISPTYAWHGRLMVLAWTLLLPVGMLTARFFKVTRQQRWPQHLDNKFWWRTHLGLQVSGILIMSMGVAIVWFASGSAWGHSLHAALGWLLVMLGWLQLLGGYLRGSKGGPLMRADGRVDFARIQRGDHYDMTPRRVLFEWAHKLGGYATLVMSVWVTGLGLERARAPVWMWWVIGLWWVALTVVAFWLQSAGRNIDTYQAIWGPDARHPGNARRPIGFGIKRYRQPK